MEVGVGSCGGVWGDVAIVWVCGHEGIVMT
jgi:hypothetical protein